MIRTRIDGYATLYTTTTIESLFRISNDAFVFAEIENDGFLPTFNEDQPKMNWICLVKKTMWITSCWQKVNQQMD